MAAAIHQVIDHHMASVNNGQTTSCEEWLMLRVGAVPRNSLGWFRCGVGFYNKKEFTKAIECFEKSVQLDPMNYNAYQIMARACIAVNRKDDAINALKQSVSLDNPSDWQLLVELTSNKE
ncbi:hypothetical protein O5D80_006433 [Batrachochytrium dendrobatidis]|nr:hypothetical protein O5D80_006433 [Batrachochytrium dendrobatidis]